MHYQNISEEELKILMQVANCGNVIMVKKT